MRMNDAQIVRAWKAEGMTAMLDFSDAPKRPTNLTLNGRLLDLAREMNINLSQTVDRLLAGEIRRRYHEHWIERNKEAIADYNARIEKEGTFSADLRNFMRKEA